MDLLFTRVSTLQSYAHTCTSYEIMDEPMNHACMHDRNAHIGFAQRQLSLFHAIC